MQEGAGRQHTRDGSSSDDNNGASRDKKNKGPSCGEAINTGCAAERKMGCDTSSGSSSDEEKNGGSSLTETRSAMNKRKQSNFPVTKGYRGTKGQCGTRKDIKKVKRAKVVRNTELKRGRA